MVSFLTYFGFFAPMAYSVPSVIIYILAIYIIFKYRKSFDSSFFDLFIYDGFMNLFTFFVGFYMMRMSSITCYDCILYPLYRNAHDYFPMNFLTAMSYHMAYVQYSTTALISFNRLSVLFNHNFFEPIWKKYSWLIMLFVFAVPFLDTHRCFFYKTVIIYNEETESYALSSPMPISENFHFLIPAMVIITIVSVVLNVACLITVRNINTQKKNKAETNFIIIMSITCFVQFLGCGLSVARVIVSNKTIGVTLASILPFVSDGLTLVQPWLLVCFSNSMRGKMQQTIGKPSKGIQGTLVVVRSVTN